VIGRILGFAVGVVLFAVALIFASVLALVAGIVVIVLWIYIYWRVRKLQKEAEKRPGAVVIEGEYRVDQDTDAIDVTPGRRGDDPGGNPRR
jgi:uncharacterized membrane protein YfcA